MPTGHTQTAERLVPLRNCGRSWDLPRVATTLEEWLATASAVGIKPTAEAKTASELDKARRYLRNLSPETLSALRAEGVI